MKTGDLTPPWRISVESSDTDTDFDLVQDWRFVVSLRRQLLFVDTNPTVTVDPVNKYQCVVEHAWSAGETDQAGVLKAEIVAVWPGAQEQTFPSEGRAKLTLYDGID